jgi:hypothetical protein
LNVSFLPPPKNFGHLLLESYNNLLLFVKREETKFLQMHIVIAIGVVRPTRVMKKEKMMAWGCWTNIER